MTENAKLAEQKAKATKTLMTMLDYLGLDASLRLEEKGSKLAIKISSEDAGRIIGRKGQTLESLQLLLNRIMFRGEEDCPHVMLDIDGYARGNSRGGEDRPEGEEGEESAPRPRRERGDREERGERRDRGGDRGGDRGDRRDRGERSDRGERGERHEGGRRRRDESGEGRTEGPTEEQLRCQALDAAKEVKRWGESVVLPAMNAHDRRIIHVTLQEDTEIVTCSEGDGNLKKVVISLKKD
ncbi:MAG: protein jag [Victivallaceae bacterium]